MSFALTLPNAYGYVAISAVASTLINAIHSETTAVYRKRARVPYPNAYATAVEASTSPEKHQFNCSQKAHAQFIENHSSFLVNLLIAGLNYPEWAAGLGGVWCFARLLYMIGYTRKNNENGRGRHLGSWWVAPHLGLLGLAIASGWKMLH